RVQPPAVGTPTTCHVVYMLKNGLIRSGTILAALASPAPHSPAPHRNNHVRKSVQRCRDRPAPRGVAGAARAVQPCRAAVIASPDNVFYLTGDGRAAAPRNSRWVDCRPSSLHNGALPSAR